MKPNFALSIFPTRNRFVDTVKLSHKTNKIDTFHQYRNNDDDFVAFVAILESCFTESDLDNEVWRAARSIRFGKSALGRSPV